MKQLAADDTGEYLSHDSNEIDFSSAGLYLIGFQTAIATVACAAASVASCWLLPAPAVSAVRTLAITLAVGFGCVHRPIKIGKARGLNTIFNALRPCILIYISALVVEQLVHTCVTMDYTPTSTRRVVFHAMIALMTVSGFVRALHPLRETDAPFLLSAAAILVTALLPPPAVVLKGPLCEAASLFSAGERLLRAFLFSALYTVHVYCSTPRRNTVHDLVVCIMRCAAASIWVLGCHIFVVWLGPFQFFVALWARFGHDSTHAAMQNNYTTVDTRSDSGMSDTELGIPPPPVLCGTYSTSSYEQHRSPTPEIASSFSGSASSDGGIPVDAVSLAAIAAHQTAGVTMSSERMAQIAAGIA
jgi:hypothetical protein